MWDINAFINSFSDEEVCLIGFFFVVVYLSLSLLFNDWGESKFFSLR
jgi:hypothetical protein